ncbi:phage baseplate assembly protein V [Blastochloris tepida]|uniref:Gp5/Type VI secretion system Vgr protein OB-fold domain-containing protein n=1 Tax=Blastochloris tepida TaxID=2233851 RepID=A0A348FYH6_9HYPH|nr:phage baseplate assembly protein V [Blastochloris tepida]BBF92359.1 hypothetical protein BLTE_10440 [Blastochloris tepida]
MSLSAIHFQLAELHRRIANLVRPGVVKSFDGKSRTAIVDIGFETDARPTIEAIGAPKTAVPYTPGQQILLISPSGDPAQGIVFPYCQRDDAKSPSETDDEIVHAWGDVTIRIKADGVDVEVKDAKWRIEAGLIRGLIGDARVVVTPTVAKIRKGDSWVVVDGAAVIVSHPPIVGPDPDPH